MPSNFHRSDFENKLGNAEILLTAIKSDTPEDIAKLGISTELIAETESTFTDARQLNQEQEELKARLKAKTAELTNVMTQLTKLYGKMKKKIKADIDLELWKKYGIQDKH